MFADRVPQHDLLDALRVPDRLELTQDVQQFRPRPKITDQLIRQADRILQEDSEILIELQNRKARREEVIYHDRYG